ncbi:uncharacterized protein BJ212DRAFT_1294747 [Suillus subaureus]|uniref:Uncharacterized protein n=1 Tax=Suillus subaureus TaxID=48587 RepID=A0A9P7EPC8_9AGAM|nr:uncharacterized protein BJ212DRAFT_1294747 [Suillus subaureus]KAG1827490.1 hypothetical protein BJ212DRAFT_1294747 [Suillus subaureus]
MPSSLRPRVPTGQAVTNTHLKINWSNWEMDMSTASSLLDTPELSLHNTSYHLDSLPLSSLKDEEQFDVPELDLQVPQFDLQWLLCYTKTELIKPTFEEPDYDLDKFFVITQTRAEMPMETPQIFHGNGCTSENPVDFLKLFNHAMRQQSITVSMDKLDAFGDYLGMGSQAKIWFKALQSMSKATWPVFITEFEKCWPPIVIMEKTKAEYEKELLEFLLTDKEVGTRIMLYNQECWTHVAWATKVLQLATSAGIALSMLMIWQVRGKFLSVIKDLLKDMEYMNWMEFMKELTELKGMWLKEKKEQQAKQELEVSLLHADVAHLQQWCNTKPYHSTPESTLTNVH